MVVAGAQQHDAGVRKDLSQTPASLDASQIRDRQPAEDNVRLQIARIRHQLEPVANRPDQIVLLFQQRCGEAEEGAVVVCDQESRPLHGCFRHLAYSVKLRQLIHR